MYNTISVNGNLYTETFFKEMLDIFFKDEAVK